MHTNLLNHNKAQVDISPSASNSIRQQTESTS